MKDGYKYIIVVLLFILLVISVTLSNLYIKYETKGDITILKNYSEIKYSNIVMDNDEIAVKVDEDNNSIHISIPNLNKEANISMDINNIGLSNIVLDNYQILNINTNLNKDNVAISTSLSQNEIIKGGYSKKLLIKINNSNKNSGNYDFSINLVYKES